GAEALGTLSAVEHGDEGREQRISLLATESFVIFDRVDDATEQVAASERHPQRLGQQLDRLGKGARDVDQRLLAIIPICLGLRAHQGVLRSFEANFNSPTRSPKRSLLNESAALTQARRGHSSQPASSRKSRAH